MCQYLFRMKKSVDTVNHRKRPICSFLKDEIYIVTNDIVASAAKTIADIQ